MRSASSRRQRRQRGNAMIEFALSFLFLFPVFYGALQYGLSFHAYNALRSAVREGARYAAGKTYLTSTNSYPASWGSEVKNMVVYGNLAGTGSPIISGLQPANINVAVIFEDKVPNRITVRIQNYNMNALFRTFTFNSPSATFPYFGRYAPNGM
jgi:Flp pilus assembly protein TadG